MVKGGNMGEVVLKIDSTIIMGSTCPLYNGVLANVEYNVGGDPFGCFTANEGYQTSP